MTRVCSVVTGGTASAARSMAASLFRNEPGSRLLLIDVDGALSTGATPDWDVLALDDLRIPSQVLHEAALYLDDAGLASWLQPLALLRALEDDPAVVWLDPTSLLLRPMVRLSELALEHGLVVVPRAPVSITADGFEPDAADLPRAGYLTTSLLAASRAAVPGLRSWAEHALRATGRFSLLDQVAVTHGHLVLREPGLAISSWSIAADVCTDDGDGLRLRGMPVHHMDLAGFDPHRPWLLDSRLRAPRVRLSRQPALAEFCAGYARELLADDLAVPSRFAHLTNGIPVTPQMRRLFRRALDTRAGVPVPSDPASADAFVDWLLEPVSGSVPPLTRYLHSIHQDRPDLQEAMPGLPDRNVDELLGWANRHGRHEPDYDPHLIDRSLEIAGGVPERSRRGGRSRSGRVPHGLNVVGYLTGELGIGESARLMLAALDAAGVPHGATTVTRNLQSRQSATFAAAPAPRPFDTTLLCVNADSVPEIVPQVPDLVRGRRRIGMWYWEVETFPASLHGAFAHVDELWVATDFIRNAIQPHAPVPVRTVTPPLPVPSASTDRTRADLGLPDGYLFLFAFDYLSTAERKNPLGVVDVFRRAFPRGSGPVLIIKSINAEERVQDAERLRTAVADEPDILLLEDYLDAGARDALMLLCDCYISLHRSEGLGLTMAEAMGLGKPVIATAYGGNLQFMTEQNSFLVPWTAVPIPEGCAPYLPGTPWAQPDLDAATAMMRAVVADPTESAARGAQAAHDIADLHSPLVAGRAIARELRLSRRRTNPANRLRHWARAVLGTRP